MADQDLNDLFDLENLEEPTPFDLEEDVFGEDFEVAEEEGGVSRAFMVAVSLIVLGIVVVIVLLVLYALRGSDELTGNQKTATAIVAFNATEIAKNDATIAALNAIATATQDAQATFEARQTAQAIASATQQAVAATEAAQTATAQAATQAAATQQAILAQTATQEALDATATRIAEDRRVVVQLRTEDGQPLSNVRVRLYRDDGDQVFNPADRLIAESGPATPVPGSAPAGAQSLSYGQVGEGTLGLAERASWVFSGAAGDVVSISAEAVELTQLDTFLELFGPEGTRLISDDDSGEGSNALIAEYTLPREGTYRIEVTAIAGQGAYRLRLNVKIAVPGEPAPPAAAPASQSDTSAQSRSTQGLLLVRQAGPTATPQVLGDALMQILISELDGVVDFGTLEPGIYWLELEYDSLPAELQALVPLGQPLVLQVRVPETGAVGEITFTISAATPTPSPSPTPIPSATATPPASVTPGGPTLEATGLTPTEEPTTMVTPGAMPTTGFFSDISGVGGEIEGSSGLAVLAIAAAGLIAVVFIARKLRSSA